MGLETFNFLVIPRFSKIVLRNKIIDKTQKPKNQENYTQNLGENYLTNHLCKFLQDRIKP